MLDDFKQQGIQAVVTLNEGFELFVTTEHYEVRRPPSATAAEG